MIRRLFFSDFCKYGPVSVNLLSTGGMCAAVVTVEPGNGDAVSACAYEYVKTEKEFRETSSKEIDSPEWWLDVVKQLAGEALALIPGCENVEAEAAAFTDLLRIGRLDRHRWEVIGGMIGSAEWEEEGRLF